MNTSPATDYDDFVRECTDVHGRALARRLAEDKQAKLLAASKASASKITEAASRRMAEFRAIITPVESRALTRQVKDASTLITGAASSPVSDSALTNQRNATS